MNEKDKLLVRIGTAHDAINRKTERTSLDYIIDGVLMNCYVLLKEQEAVEPVEEFIKDTNCHYYHCKRCGNIVGTILDDKHPIFPGAKVSIKHFCDICGQAVKWE